MATISEAVQGLKSGKLDVSAAAEQIKAAMGASSEGSRPAPESPDYTDSAMRRFADKDDAGFDASFNKVTAAWIGGDITDGQYHTLREAVLPNSGKKPSETSAPPSTKGAEEDA